MTPPDFGPGSLLATALEAADAAAAVHRRWAGRITMKDSTAKGFGDFVSRVDLDAQDAALSVLRHRFPEHAVLAEEGADDVEAVIAGTSPHWIVDPLDGTKNFLHGHPNYASSVAVAVEGRVVAAAVVASTTGERWWASAGCGAWKNGRSIRVSRTAHLASSLVGTGFPFKSLDLLPSYLGQFRRVLEKGGAIRRDGAASLDLCYLAEGRFDAFWELFLHPWDFAAGMLIVGEAGGVMARSDGAELTLASGSVSGANSDRLLEELLETVREG